MKLLEKRDIWQRIASFPLDEKGVSQPFSKKLSQEQKWTESYALRAIAEYKKYMLLCMTEPSGASPSKAVDEVWHLHMTYSHNYAEFCTATAGTFLHHNPSKGGTDEHVRHKQWYIDTLKNYILTFDGLPPNDIWDVPNGFDGDVFLSEKAAFKTVKWEGEMGNQAPKPPLVEQYWQLIIYACFSIFAVFMLFNPKSMTGATFLVAYAVLFIISF